MQGGTDWYPPAQRVVALGRNAFREFFLSAVLGGQAILHLEELLFGKNRFEL